MTKREIIGTREPAAGIEHKFANIARLDNRAAPRPLAPHTFAGRTDCMALSRGRSRFLKSIVLCTSQYRAFPDCTQHAKWNMFYNRHKAMRPSHAWECTSQHAQIYSHTRQQKGLAAAALPCPTAPACHIPHSAAGMTGAAYCGCLCPAPLPVYSSRGSEISGDLTTLRLMQIRPEQYLQSDLRLEARVWGSMRNGWQACCAACGCEGDLTLKSNPVIPSTHLVWEFVQVVRVFCRPARRGREAKHVCVVQAGKTPALSVLVQGTCIWLKSWALRACGGSLWSTDCLSHEPTPVTRVTHHW